MTKEEIEHLEMVKVEQPTVIISKESFAKVINYNRQLEQENKEIKDNHEIIWKEQQKTIEKQKEILDILKPHLKTVQDPNGLVGLEYDMSALNMKEQQLIKEWLGNDRV